MIERSTIEKEARRLQFEIWHKRELLFPYGIPPLHLMFQPAIAARVLDLEYEQREYIGAGKHGQEAAGILDRSRGIISISLQFPHTVQRFTGAHEVGHFLLHPHLGINSAVHRDKPIYAMNIAGRPDVEQDADYFAACLLAPQRLVREEFTKRFGSQPLRLDETLAWHLCKDSYTDLYIEPRRLKFAAAVAGAQKLDKYRFTSLSQHFELSLSAMAIRLHELELVLD
jgi:hypothetical protein